MKIGEREDKGRINYMDLTIKTNKGLGRMEYEIYRKPTATDTIIHNSSNHPQQHKNAEIRQLVERLERTPLTRATYTKELNTINTILENKKDIVEKIKREIRTNDKKSKEKQVRVLYSAGPNLKYPSQYSCP